MIFLPNGGIVKKGEDFTSDLIKSLNKEHGSRVAYNLAEDYDNEEED